VESLGNVGKRRANFGNKEIESREYWIFGSGKVCEFENKGFVSCIMKFWGSDDVE
jgi:hypothetical protein